LPPADLCNAAAMASRTPKRPLAQRARIRSVRERFADFALDVPVGCIVLPLRFHHFYPPPRKGDRQVTDFLYSPGQTCACGRRIWYFCPYFPSNRAGRFSKNAATASLWSLVLNK